MSNNWLTIPDAPNYEINSNLVVRNKKTKKILATHTQTRGSTPSCSLINNGKIIIRTVKLLREQAVADVEKETWSPVPSLNNLYEFSNKNKLRNAKTKRRLALTPKKDGYRAYINGKLQYVSLTALRWEMYGILPPVGSKIHKPCIIEKCRTRRYFGTRRAAIEFIAQTEFYSVKWITELFVKRHIFIYGWRINYLEEETQRSGCYLSGASKYPKEE